MMVWMLAILPIASPLFWAVFIGWVLSVVLHEFAHGIVAYWGGDYTIRERGGLTLNPLQYVDPLMSIIIPIIFLLAGGIPLPGGATYVRRDLLRSPLWDSAVSFAGPLMNFLIFLACCVPLLPRFGWLDPTPGTPWTNAQLLLGASAILQITSVILNLIPVPPLDGYGIIRPWLPVDIRRKLAQPQVSMAMFAVLFILLSSSGGFWGWMYRHVIFPLLGRIGFDYHGLLFFWEALRRALYPKG